MFYKVLITPRMTMAARLCRRSFARLGRESVEYNTREGNKAGGSHTAVISSRCRPELVCFLPRSIPQVPNIGRQRARSPVLCAGVLLLLALINPAYAQKFPGRCAHYDVFMEHIAAHGEVRMGRGLGRQHNTLIELHAVPDGTFTIIMVAPTGKTCLLTHGNNWTAYEAKPGKPT